MFVIFELEWGLRDAAVAFASAAGARTILFVMGHHGGMALACVDELL